MQPRLMDLFFFLVLTLLIQMQARQSRSRQVFQTFTPLHVF